MTRLEKIKYYTSKQLYHIQECNRIYREYFEKRGRKL